jgi:hypothetical protein
MYNKKYFLGVVKNNRNNIILCRYFHEDGILINAITNKEIDIDELASSEFNSFHEQPATFRNSE